jgi:hypothetical protein
LLANEKIVLVDCDSATPPNPTISNVIHARKPIVKVIEKISQKIL